MLIEYKNVNVYQDDREVLRGVDFHVDEVNSSTLLVKWDRERVRFSKQLIVNWT